MGMSSVRVSPTAVHSAATVATPAKKQEGNRVQRWMARMGVRVGKKPPPAPAPMPTAPRIVATAVVTPVAPMVPPQEAPSSEPSTGTFVLMGPALPANVVSTDAEIAAPALIQMLQDEPEANRLFSESERFRTKVRALLMDSTITQEQRAAIVDGVRFNDVAPQPLKDLAAYADYLATQRVESVRGLSRHSYAGDNSPRTLVKELSKEVAFLHEHLPIDLNAPVLFRFDERNLQRGKFLIVGAPGTPYSGGVFLFHFNAVGYPNVAPQVTFATTNGGQFRFNPNLYANGKVCLSLLGTWDGPGWQPRKSNLLQVAVSIQTAVMNANPYINEPGFERDGNTSAARLYRENVEQATVQYAMIDAMKNPDPDFADFIKLHFKAHRERVEKLSKKWTRVSAGQRQQLALALATL